MLSTQFFSSFYLPVWCLYSLSDDGVIVIYFLLNNSHMTMPHTAENNNASFKSKGSIRKRRNMSVKMSWKSNELIELKEKLRNPAQNYTDEISGIVECLKKVLFLTITGTDTSELFSEVLLTGATSSIIVKKIVHQYLFFYASRNADLAILTVNNFQKDCTDENPMVRGVSLRSFSSLRLSYITEYIPPILRGALLDKSPYVKCIAIYCFLELTSSNLISTEIDPVVLEKLTHDCDRDVSNHAFLVLHKLRTSARPHERGQGFKNDICSWKNLVYFQLSRLKEMSDWQKMALLSVLSHYEVEDDDQMYMFMNLLEEHIRSTSAALLTSISHFFFRISQANNTLLAQVCHRLKTPLLLAVAYSSHEIRYSILFCLETIAKVVPQSLHEEYTSFYCKQGDPSYVKMIKLRILSRIISTENLGEITYELVHCINETRNQQSVWKSCFELFSSICRTLKEEKWNTTLSWKQSHELVTQSIRILTKRCGDFYLQSLMVHFLVHAIPILQESDRHDIITFLVNLKSAKACFIYPEFVHGVTSIIREYPNCVPNAPYILLAFARNMRVLDDISRTKLLKATMAQLQEKPAEATQVLKTFLQTEISTVQNANVYDLALLCYRSLRKSNLSASIGKGPLSRIQKTEDGEAQEFFSNLIGETDCTGYFSKQIE